MRMKWCLGHDADLGSIRKNKILAGVMFTSLVMLSTFLLSCTHAPAFSTLPVTSPTNQKIVGTWAMSYNDYAFVFKPDGTGERLTYKSGMVSESIAFEYRVTETALGIHYFTGGYYTRLIKISADGMQINLLGDSDYSPGIMTKRSS